jgi:hypothetical protein
VTRVSKKPAKPSAATLTAALGPTRELWDDLRDQVRRDFAPVTEDWVFSGQRHGWALRLKHKQRAVLYLKPLQQCFRVSLALGPKAVDAAHNSRLPAAVIRLIDDAVQYPEGKAVRIDIHNAKDVDVALQLVAIKLAS